MLVRFSAVVFSSVLLVGCSGGGSDDAEESASNSVVSTGVFLDAPVSGLTYTTETQAGVTNDAGEFSYVAGESVSFSLHGLELGQADAMETVPVTALPNGLAIAVILQSLDTDPAEGVIAVDDVQFMDSSLQVLSEIVSGEQSDSALDVSVLNDIKQATTQAGGTQPYLDAPVDRLVAIEHVKQQLLALSGEEFSFTTEWLDNRMMVTTNTLLGGPNQSKYAMRFDKDEQLRFIGYSETGDNFNYDKLDRTITTDGNLSVVMSDGSTCVWEPIAETEYTVETIASCDEGVTQVSRSFYISQPMTDADLDGKSYTVTSENGDSPFEIEFSDGSVNGEDRVFGYYQTSVYQGIYANFGDGADVWFLIKGDTDNGIMMNWGFTLPEDTAETMSFVELTDGSSWYGYNWAYPYE